MTKKALKPIVKWAGGKGQLIGEISSLYPKGLGTSIKRYAEPFVGGGAVLFDILSKYDMDEVYISDINAELINMYCKVKTEASELVSLLSTLQEQFIPLSDSERKIYYYERRSRYNGLILSGKSEDSLESAALFIFLNRTCFNGLYRVNSKGLYNVPMGAYKNPQICDADNIMAASEALQNVEIVCGDYKESEKFIDKNTFVYFDPPYRPLNATSNFTSYTENDFGDKEQVELSEFAGRMRKKGAQIVLSNSDPKNTNSEDEFFDKIYSSYIIRRVEATRMINCNSASRGRIKELLISNY
ncbi:MAG: DNA adenine methylase [Oscillospiraceae bacterium]|nr:DNA adenine methylase [Oscillospiraceae bacterium]